DLPDLDGHHGLLVLHVRPELLADLVHQPGRRLPLCAKLTDERQGDCPVRADDDLIRQIWHLPDGDAELVRGADHELVLARVVLFLEGVVGGRELTGARRQEGDQREDEQGAEKKGTDATKRRHEWDLMSDGARMLTYRRPRSTSE